MKDIEKWIKDKFGCNTDDFISLLEMSPSSQGYIHGAASELELKKQLEQLGYEVWRIKEKPAGGFDQKKEGYKGDFLIKAKGREEYYVVECKGIKTNAEFRSGDTDDYVKSITREQAINFLKKYIGINKKEILDKGQKSYLKKKAEWESKHAGRTYPEFHWSEETPGPDSPDLTNVFSSKEDIECYVNSLPDEKFSEQAFRECKGVYVVMQTHKPSGRTDPETGERIAAPLISDFSILAVDLFQRIGEHKFVFVNPDKLSHSPQYPNHLYQNYIIDILIPGKKDQLSIKAPWYEDIRTCIEKTKPRTVTYDDSQLDHRDN